MENVYIDIRQYERYYVGKYLKRECKVDLVSVDEIIGIMEELLAENERLNEKYDDYKQFVEDNYKQITPEQMYS